VNLGELVAPSNGRAPAPVSPSAAPAIREVSRSSGSTADIDRTDDRLRRALAAAVATPSVTTHIAAAEEYRRLGILDRAMAHLQQGAQFDEHDVAVNDALARTWRDFNLPGFGLTYAYRAVYAAPRSATARHTLGTIFYAMGRHADAEHSFRSTVALDPSAWYAWQNLCHVVMADGRTQEAIELCHRASAARREH
jgi:tetratricopeptide (TPR) repeat protein